jgi:ribonucleoside-diphosphate reductase beta chain
MLKILPQDDSDFVKIRQETESELISMYEAAAAQEKDWAGYLFRNGSMIGLNQQLLSDYVDWITHKRMTAIGLSSSFKGGSNPLPWTQKWIAGADVQVAPQETEISSYVVGGTKQDVTENTLAGLSL